MASITSHTDSLSKIMHFLRLVDVGLMAPQTGVLTYNVN